MGIISAEKIPMLDLRQEFEYMRDDIENAIAKCMEHQNWILGPEVNELESNIAGYLGVEHCTGASSGTESLVLALRALAIKTKGTEFFSNGEQVITTPFTFTATGDAIIRAGATPVFVDIDPLTYNMNVDKVKAYLSVNGSKVAGILPVHLYGRSCDMDGIMGLADEYGLFVVEDVAQAFGGQWKGRRLGSIGDAGAFSFFPSKNLGGFGDGGMMATNDHELDGLARMLLKHGGKDKYNVDHIGYNARLDTLQAAVLLAKMRYIEEFNALRRSVAALYDEALDGLNGLVLPSGCPGGDVHHVYHQYTVRVAGGRRDDLRNYLSEKNISTMIYYPMPLHMMKVFRDRCIVYEGLGEAEKAVNEVLSLPIEPLMNEDVIAQVSGSIRKFFSKRQSGKKISA